MTVVPFVMLRPEDLPVTAAWLRGVAGLPAHRALAALLTVPDPLPAVRAARERIGGLVPCPAWPGPSTDRATSIDQLFGIVRAAPGAPATLGHSILGGYEELLCELVDGGTDLLPFEVRRLHRAFLTLLDLVSSGAPVAAGTWPVPSAPPGTRRIRTGAHAWRRWCRGHRIFTVVVQGLVIMLGGLVERPASTDGRAAALGATVRLLRGARAALAFAADLPLSVYERDIRPRMMPPHAPSGVSGTWWSDHALMITMLRALRPHLAELRAELPGPVRVLRRELRLTYAAHRMICGSVVGHTAPSLLAGAGDVPATVTLARLGRVRLRLLDPTGGH